MGTPAINLACFITLIAVVRRPPTYTEGDPQPKTADELNHEARVISSFLVIAHFFTSIFRMMQSNMSLKKYVVSFVSLGMAVWGVINAAIATNWSFPRAPNSTYLISIGLFPT